MQWRNYINEYVFGLMDSESIQFKNSVENLYVEAGNLNIIDGNYPIDEKMIQKLERQYTPFIIEKRFSKRMGEWYHFSDEDMGRINEVSI